MRIRFFNTFEPVSPTYRDLIPYLAEHGHEIEVLITSAEYRQGRPRLEEHFTHPNIRVSRLWSGPRAIGGTWKKLLIILTYMFGAMARTLFGRSVDLNFFLTQPPLFAAWGWVLHLLRRQPYAMLVMDIYPDVAIRSGLLRPRGLLARCLTWLSRFALRRARRVIAIGRCMQEFLESEGVPADRIRFIPNWVNESEVYPVPAAQNSLRQELGAGARFIVLYSGNLGVSHYFDDILEVARRLSDHSDMQFVFVGDGVRRGEIEGAKARYGLSNVLLCPFQPSARLAESLSLGDVHFISLRDGYEGLVVPSKAYGALGAARPTIYQGDSDGEIARMIVEQDIGSVVPLGDPQRLMETILRYYQEPDFAVAQGRRAWLAHSKRYSRLTALEQYAELFSEHQPGVLRLAEGERS